MRDYRTWLAIGGLFVAGWLLYPVLAGDRSSPVREELQAVVYVCRDSGETFLLRSKTSPEKHPRTGQFTLMPGLYCEKCQAWKAVGPLDSLQRRSAPLVCPKHKIPLTIDGPRPETMSSPAAR